MANKTAERHSVDEGWRVKLLDQGDGTHAEVMATTTASASLGTAGSGTANTSAAAIGATQACSGVSLANTGATTTLLWGLTASQVMPLAPGEKVWIPVADVALVFVKTASSTTTFAYQPVS